jgi:hypothetical protein
VTVDQELSLKTVDKNYVFVTTMLSVYLTIVLVDFK